MARLSIDAGLVLILAAVLWTGAAAQSNCTGTLVNLSPCLSYVTGNTRTPASECCRRLAGVVESQPQCLCEALRLGGTSVSAGLNINVTLAMGLPGACNIQTPDISSCNALSPANSPAGSPRSPISPFPTGSGSETAPPTDNNSAALSSAKSSMSMLFFLLFVGSYASVFSAQ